MRKPVSKLNSLPLSVAAGLLAGLVAAAPALAESTPTVARVISVTGEGSVARAPDLASLSIGVNNTADAAAQALSENSTAMQAVVDRLKADGIAPRDLQTTGLSVNPNWVSSGQGNGPAKIAGFTASNSLTVTVRDLDKLGAVIDAVVADGANTLNGVSFALADPRPAQDEARRAAVADARAKAELFADAAGLKLGELVSISEGGSYGGGPQPMFRMDAMAASVPIERGEISQQASVSISWTLVQ